MKILKVGLNPKQQLQLQKFYDFASGIITTTGTQYWRIVTDSPVTDPMLLLSATDGANTVPVIGQDWNVASPTGCICNRTHPMLQTDSHGQVWILQADFSSRPQANFKQSKWDITISIDGVPVTETIYQDSAGTPIVNTAGQPFQQQPSETYFDRVYRIGFKSKMLDVASIDGLQGCLNQNAFTLNVASLGFSKSFEAQSTELARCPTSTVLTGDPTQPAYWQVEYELYYRAPITTPQNVIHGSAGKQVSGWTQFILNQGYCQKGSGSTPNPILDPKTGLPINSPVYLDSSGNVTSTPYFIQFAPAQPTADFSPLFAGIG